MNGKAQKVLDELAGREAGQDNKLRNTAWYGRWDSLAEDLLKQAERHAVGKILQRVFDLLEDCHGHHHAHTAASSKKALELVRRERKLK